MSTEALQIKQEVRVLSRYSGTIITKWVTFFLLIPACFCLAPISIYIILLTLLLPYLLQAAFNHKNSVPICYLSQTAQKYHYSYKKYCGEKNANPLLLLFLLVWQYKLNSDDLPIVWQIYPALVLVANIVIRLAGTVLFRFYLHYRFFHLNTLDQ